MLASVDIYCIMEEEEKRTTKEKDKKMKTFYFYSFDGHKFIGEAKAADWMTAQKIVADATGFPINDLLPYSSKSIWNF